MQNSKCKINFELERSDSPYWNAYLGQWQVWVNFADECRSVVCDWLVAV
ncbi:hypothetical protein [Nostoc sp. UIC 10630]|nr:hypothetical protein [Nostoc sp. UIC 10630]NEU82839.1 hypothetical protein [Nostoc sp. UIC 10630]